jgi:glycosyltransferase involved in cell wall biosynthesis
MSIDKLGISIIIPCYNCETLIDETLESLKNQTYKNFEVICVNDGSKDGTLRKLKKYQQEGVLTIKIIDQSNGGVGNARNNGLHASVGKYILFLDSDDIYHKEIVEKLYTSLVESGADTAYSRLSRKIDYVKKYSTQINSYQLHDQHHVMSKLLWEMGNYGFYCFIYKKNILVQHSILFDENTKYGEDREFIWKYLTHCSTAAWIDMPLYGYRINKNSVTQRVTSWNRTDSINAVKRTERYLKENKCEFYSQYRSYMYAREMWAIAKSFALNNRKDFFKRLGKEYDVYKCMKRTYKDRNKLVALASFLYLIHPNLFFHAIRIMGRVF